MIFKDVKLQEKLIIKKCDDTVLELRMPENASYDAGFNEYRIYPINVYFSDMLVITYKNVHMMTAANLNNFLKNTTTEVWQKEIDLIDKLTSTLGKIIL